MSDYLFAYGTLQPGLAPDAIAPQVARMQVEGKGSVRGLLYDFGEYPGAVADPKQEHRIFGTVLELNGGEAQLHWLDEYEGFYPDAPDTSQFVRKRVTAWMTDGRELDCWVYYYNGDPGGARRIGSGVYRR